MDAFVLKYLYNLKTEKQNARLRYRCLQNIANFFRILQLCLILVFLSWISSRLPLILELSKEYFRKFISVIISPLFIFLISNVIVLMLLAKSGKLTASRKPDTFEEFSKINKISVNLEPGNCSRESEKEVVYQDKRIIDEIKTVTYDSFMERASVPELFVNQKVLRRSQSENLKVEILKKACGNLRRSETEIISRGTECSEEMLAECVEELSNEEFRRRIEAFIEKQLRFHKEVKFALVPHI